jgi:hypothetical protein
MSVALPVRENSAGTLTPAAMSPIVAADAATTAAALIILFAEMA